MGLSKISLISSAAYLKIIKDKTTSESIIGVIILADNELGELFYNMEDGFEIINDYLSNKTISQEEREYLAYEIENSGLLEEGIEEMDKNIDLIKEQIYLLKNTGKYSDGYIKLSLSTLFPAWPKEAIEYFIQQINDEINLIQSSIN